MKMNQLAIAVLTLCALALLVVAGPLTGWFIARRQRLGNARVRPVSATRDTVEFERPFFSDNDSDFYFYEDPLGSHSLPTTLDGPALHTAVFAELVADSVVSPEPSYVDATWTDWGYLLDDEERAALDVDGLQLELELLSCELVDA